MELSAYLERIGLDPTAPPPTLDTLHTVHRAHLAAVPFENLDIHLGVPITLDEDAIVAKIVEGRRGGFCYELNGGLAWLLTALGYDVSFLEGRVHKRDGGIGVPFDHLCLAVHTVDSDKTFLVDVGFGASFLEPLVLQPGVEQHDPAGAFVIDPQDEGWFDLCWGDRRQYRFHPRPRAFADFAPGCAFHQTAESHFGQNPVCSLPTGNGRITLAGRLLVETIDGQRRERVLEEGDLKGVYESRFGVVLDDAQVSKLNVLPPPAG